MVAWFKAHAGLDGATGGTAWIELIEQTLAAHALAGPTRPAPEISPDAEKGVAGYGTMAQDGLKCP